MRPLLLCYTEKGIPAAPAMARPEAHFRNRATLEKGKKQIRAANAILNPHGIWADRKRVSNHKPRKGTETGAPHSDGEARIVSFKSQTPQGDGNASFWKTKG